MDLYGDLPPAAGDETNKVNSSKAVTIAPGGWARPNASLVPKKHLAPVEQKNVLPTSSIAETKPTTVSTPTGNNIKSSFSTIAFKPRQANIHQNAIQVVVPASETVTKKVNNDDKAKNIIEEPKSEVIASFEVDDPYDPGKPNDYLLWCEERLERKRRIRIDEENRRTVLENERIRVAIELERAAASEKGDVQRLRETATAIGRGRGRGVTNLPAWMTASNNSVESFNDNSVNNNRKSQLDPTSTQFQDFEDDNNNINIASKLMNKMGYQEGSGLGRSGQGITKPIEHHKVGSSQGIIMVDHNDRQRLASANNTSTTTDNNDHRSLAEQRVKPKKIGLFSNPSCVVLLTNMVPPGDPVGNLAEETKEECLKYGPIKKCEVFVYKPNTKQESVRTFVAFELQESALKAFRDLNGRYFGGLQIGVRFFDEDRFNKKDLVPGKDEEI